MEYVKLSRTLASMKNPSMRRTRNSKPSASRSSMIDVSKRISTSSSKLKLMRPAIAAGSAFDSPRSQVVRKRLQSCGILRSAATVPGNDLPSELSRHVAGEWCSTHACSVPIIVSSYFAASNSSENTPSTAVIANALPASRSASVANHGLKSVCSLMSFQWRNKVSATAHNACWSPTCANAMTA
ncbi:hypothetical protein D3C81_839870 [compost metagenome]